MEKVHLMRLCQGSSWLCESENITATCMCVRIHHVKTPCKELRSRMACGMSPAVLV